jgi:hypothetical protein
MLEFVGLLYFALCIVVGGVAYAKNRNFIGWALLSLLITPFFALLALIAVPAKPDDFVSADSEWMLPRWFVALTFVICAIVGVRLALHNQPQQTAAAVTRTATGPAAEAALALKNATSPVLTQSAAPIPMPWPRP